MFHLCSHFAQCGRAAFVRCSTTMSLYGAVCASFSKRQRGFFLSKQFPCTDNSAVLSFLLLASLSAFSGANHRSFSGPANTLANDDHTNANEGKKKLQNKTHINSKTSTYKQFPRITNAIERHHAAQKATMTDSNSALDVHSFATANDAVKPKTVMVAVGGEKYIQMISWVALNLGRRLLFNNERDKLLVVHVPQATAVHEDELLAAGLTPQSTENILDALKKHSKSQSEAIKTEIVARLTAAGLDSKRFVVVVLEPAEDAREQLLAASSAYKADIVVVGYSSKCKGEHNPTTKPVMGATARYLVEYAPMSVVIAK